MHIRIRESDSQEPITPIYMYMLPTVLNSKKDPMQAQNLIVVGHISIMTDIRILHDQYNLLCKQATQVLSW